MESFTLIAFCFGIFGLFALSEVIKLKKEVNKLKGIVRHLLEKEKERKG